MPIKGIDVSEHQGKINWDKVKKSGIKYAILRCGYGMDITSQDDSEFERNIKECEKRKIPYGVYLFSYADTVEKAKSEALHTLRRINGYKPRLGVWYDIEDNKTSGKVNKQMLSNIIHTYCNIIKNSGYRVGVYASVSWLDNKIEKQIKNQYPIWVAQYYDKCEYTGKYTMWQYTSCETVDGIQGNVDGNYLYEEYLIEGKESEISKNQLEKINRIKELQKCLNKDFQTQLIEDGIIGSKTMQVIQMHYLKYYTSGQFVKWTQTQLDRKEYYLGKCGVDGKYGKDTQTAVRKYQKDKKLIIDGCTGAEVIQSLLQ